MRITFVIHTPGQVHLWHYPIKMLKEDCNDVLVLAREDEFICKLLKAYDISFDTYGKAGKTALNKIAQLPSHLLHSFNIIRKFRPDIIIGTGIIEAYSAFILRKPCVIFEDSEITPTLERSQWKRLANVILTPECFQRELGKKQIRFAGYKELAYLHPNHFIPDPTIYDDLKIKRGEKYVILRFNIFNAVHDIRRSGFTVSDQFSLVKELERYAHVLISPERLLPKELEEYRLLIPYYRIHHALYYAQMLVCDTGTMATEAAVLGTPVIMCINNGWEFGNFTELDRKYKLLYRYTDANEAINKATELIQQFDLKEQWLKKRQILLADKIDVTKFLVDFIENKY